MLKFSPANAKTQALMSHPQLAGYLAGRRKVYSFDLPAGVTCPGALDCNSQCVPKEGGGFTIQDGPHCKFRCFSASQEVVYNNVRKARAHNLALFRNILNGIYSTSETLGRFVSLIEQSMPNNLGVCRLHVSGDFWHSAYLEAWKLVARNHPDRLFYAYTKSLHYFTKKDFIAPRVGRLLDNFYLTASRGGRFDSEIKRLGLRTAEVVFSETEAGRLPIDHDDSHAATSGYSFALLLHGIQPKGSAAASALQTLKRAGIGSYSRKRGK